MTNKEDYEYDVFISHASEDKESFVSELAAYLIKLGVKVWYDAFSLRAGDSLSGSIDEGLVKSKFGIVVFSPAFFEKRWTEYELRGLVTKQIQDKGKILPIWHNISKEEISQYSPSLADIVALQTKDRIESVVIGLLKVIKPELYKALTIQAKWNQIIASGEKGTKPAKEFVQSPRRRTSLTTNQIIRIRIIQALLAGIDKLSFEGMYDSFLRDLSVENELHQWEHMALVVHLYKKETSCTSIAAKNLLGALLFHNMIDTQPIEADPIAKTKIEKAGLDMQLVSKIIEETYQHPTLTLDQDK